MGRRTITPHVAHHLAFNPTPTVVELRCGLVDKSRQTWTFDAEEKSIGCPGCLMWVQASAAVPTSPVQQASAPSAGDEKEAFTYAFTARAIENSMERAAQLSTILKVSRASFLECAGYFFDRETAAMTASVQRRLCEIASKRKEASHG